MLTPQLQAALMALNSDEDIDAANGIIKHRKQEVLNARIAALLAGPDFVTVRINGTDSQHQVTKQNAASMLLAGTHTLV